jgi:hypothetical protein
MPYNPGYFLGKSVGRVFKDRVTYGFSFYWSILLKQVISVSRGMFTELLFSG